MLSPLLVGSEIPRDCYLLRQELLSLPVCHTGLAAEHQYRGRTSSTRVFRGVGAAGSSSAEISTRDLSHSKMFMLKAAARPLSLESNSKDTENEEGQDQGWERCRMNTS